MIDIFIPLEPPILMYLSDDNIQQYKVQPLKLDIPSNTQFLKRFVQTVFQFGTVAADPKIRDGFVKAALTIQRDMPSRETKADF